MFDSGLQEEFWERKGHVCRARGTESTTEKYRNTGTRPEKYRKNRTIPEIYQKASQSLQGALDRYS